MMSLKPLVGQHCLHTVSVCQTFYYTYHKHVCAHTINMYANGFAKQDHTEDAIWYPKAWSIFIVISCFESSKV